MFEPLLPLFKTLRPQQYFEADADDGFLRRLNEMTATTTESDIDDNLTLIFNMQPTDVTLERFLYKRVEQIELKRAHILGKLLNDAHRVLSENDLYTFNATMCALIQMHRELLNILSLGCKFSIRISCGISSEHMEYNNQGVFRPIVEVNGDQCITKKNRLLTNMFLLLNFYEAFLDCIEDPTNEKQSICGRFVHYIVYRMSQSEKSAFKNNEVNQQIGLLFKLLRVKLDSILFNYLKRDKSANIVGNLFLQNVKTGEIINLKRTIIGSICSISSLDMHEFEPIVDPNVKKFYIIESHAIAHDNVLKSPKMAKAIYVDQEAIVFITKGQSTLLNHFFAMKISAHHPMLTFFINDLDLNGLRFADQLIHGISSAYSYLNDDLTIKGGAYRLGINPYTLTRILEYGSKIVTDVKEIGVLNDSLNFEHHEELIESVALCRVFGRTATGADFEILKTMEIENDLISKFGESSLLIRHSIETIEYFNFGEQYERFWNQYYRFEDVDMGKMEDHGVPSVFVNRFIDIVNGSELVSGLNKLHYPVFNSVLNESFICPLRWHRTRIL